MTSESTTFASLRAKTDRELAAIIGHQLERGLRSQHPSEAEQALQQAARLLPTIYELPLPERAQLESQLAELRRRVAPGSPAPERG